MTIPRRYFDKSIVPAIGTKPVRDVTTEDVRAIIWRKKDEGFDAAAGEIRGVLKRLFDYAMTAGLVDDEPGAGAAHAPRPQGQVARAGAVS